MKVKKYRWIVQSDGYGWHIFGAGFTYDLGVAQKQCAVFRQIWPDRIFQVHEQEVKK